MKAAIPSFGVPFAIDFPRADVDELQRRVATARWPELPFQTGWSSGTNDPVLRDLARYWQESYDWFEVQAELNKLDHFRGAVGGEQMHFVLHPAVAESRRLPILLLHGWPGSFVEFNDAAPRLAREGFDLIVPSLPGFVFSDPPRTAGMNPTRIAERMHLLMEALGCDRYGVQGGDWGAVVARELGHLFPEHVAGVHLNLAPWLPEPKDRPPTSEEQEYLERRNRFDLGETGYWSIQGTKPQTLSYGLQDSPLGLLAWVLEKFWAWADHGDDLWESVCRDAVLTNVSLYWLTGRILSAARIYHEAWAWWPGDSSRVTVPTGYARFPKEPWGPPASLVAPLFNLVHATEMPKGGHFAALEQPELFAQDVAAFFSKL
ncbi:MAG TPA: epoxide hydrolase [Verrucomicrobiota bacterium]|nr:epoxide hydrolase [Verrucomicrobiota bacterium]